MYVPLPRNSYSIPLFSLSIPTPYLPTLPLRTFPLPSFSLSIQLPTFPLPLFSLSIPTPYLPTPFVLPGSEYLDRIKTQVMDWFRNIEKQPLEIVEAADGTLITSHPEDMFNVIHVQVTPHTDT